MRYFIENGISVTFATRFGRVKNFSECNKTCNANSLNPFQLQDFYNYADSLNKTNFLFFKNDTNSTTDDLVNSITYEAKMRKNQEKTARICTDVQYDFGRRKWSDEKALESTDFVLEWEKKFKQLWDSNEDVWPPQPYQPELVVLNYEVLKINNKLTISIDSYGLSPAQRAETEREPFYKCLDREDIQIGSYYDALKDCQESNSSFRTYLNQVGSEAFAV